MAESGRRPGRNRAGWIFYWVLTGLAVLVLAGGVATVLVSARAFSVPSTSMENTIRPGDLVAVSRTTHVRRGDVIILRQTRPVAGDYIRRVIGLPGDRVACCAAQGRITVNGKPLRESYLHPGDAPAVGRFSVTVPAGDLWLMGDHRSITNDSKALGPLHGQVIGWVFLLYRSGRPIYLRTPETFTANGLAPADNRVPPAVIGLAAAGLALLFLIVLAINGIVCYVTGRRRRHRMTDTPAPPQSPATPSPSPGSAE